MFVPFLRSQVCRKRWARDGPTYPPLDVQNKGGSCSTGGGVGRPKCGRGGPFGFQKIQFTYVCVCDSEHSQSNGASGQVTMNYARTQPILLWDPSLQKIVKTLPMWTPLGKALCCLITFLFASCSVTRKWYDSLSHGQNCLCGP